MAAAERIIVGIQELYKSFKLKVGTLATKEDFQTFIPKIVDNILRVMRRAKEQEQALDDNEKKGEEPEDNPLPAAVIAEEPKPRKHQRARRRQKRTLKAKTPSPDRGPSDKKKPNQPKTVSVLVKIDGKPSRVINVRESCKVLAILTKIYHLNELRDGKLMFEGKPVDLDRSVASLGPMPTLSYVFQLAGGVQTKPSKRE